MSLSELAAMCDRMKAELMGYKVTDIRRLADRVGLCYKSSITKANLCEQLKEHMVKLQMQTSISESIRLCQNRLLHLQQDDIMARFDPRDAQKKADYLFYLLETSMWLTDQALEFEKRRDDLRKLPEIGTTVQNTCRRTADLVTATLPPERRNSTGRFGW